MSRKIKNIPSVTFISFVKDIRVAGSEITKYEMQISENLPNVSGRKFRNELFIKTLSQIVCSASTCVRLVMIKINHCECESVNMLFTRFLIFF